MPAGTSDGRLHRRTKPVTPVTFDGTQLRTFAVDHHLQLWIVVTKSSQRDMWMAYDTVGYESALTITS
jgi:hypothetical protein